MGRVRSDESDPERSRTWLPAVATAVTAIAIVAGIGLLANPHPHSSDDTKPAPLVAVMSDPGIIPWADRPATEPPSTSATGTKSPYDRLKVAVTIPGSRFWGLATVHYTVTLTNPTDTSIVLDPCPIYSEHADSQTPLYFHLNCDAVPAIGPGVSVTFAMELQLPRHGSYDLPVFWAIPNTSVQVFGDHLGG